MKKSIKKILPLVLFLIVFLALIGGLLKFYLTGQPEPVSVEQMNDALISQDLQPVDITDSAQGNFPGAGLNKCVVAEQGDIRFEFYDFDNQSSALKVYREARKLIITTKMAAPRTEIETGKANFKFYSLAADGNYSVTIYVKNTAIYAYCDEENQSKIITILDAIGYVDAEPKQEVSARLLSVMRILQFVLYILMALVGRSFFWRAAYTSAGVTIRQMDNLGKTRKELYDWIVEVSLREKTTRAILMVYKLYLLPVYICIALAVVGCCVTFLDEILNVMGVVIPLEITTSACGAHVLATEYARKNKGTANNDPRMK